MQRITLHEKQRAKLSLNMKAYIMEMYKKRKK